MGERLDQPRFLKSCESSTLLDGLQCSSGDNEVEALLKLRNIDLLLLEIWILSNDPGRVELGSTSTVGVASTSY